MSDERRRSRYPEGGLQRQTHNESIPENMKSELETSPDNEVYSLSEETPQTPAACLGETEESLTNLDKIPFSSVSESSKESPQTVRNQGRKKPRVPSDPRADPVHPKEAWELSDTVLEGAAVITKETVTDRDQAMQKDQRLEGLEIERSSDCQTPKAGDEQVSAAQLNRLLDAWTALEILDFENIFSFNGNKYRQKRTTPLVKHYDNGQTFTVLFPDGTGHVCYPSGRLAVILAASQSADWCGAVVLADVQPHVQAVFTTRGQGTCYHNNGYIWVNLTPWGGTYCSDTGELKKQWSWLDSLHHVHAPPYQALHLSLSPNIHIHMHSQEDIGVAFTCGKRSVRLNVGSKLKPNQDEDLTLPGPEMFQEYLQEKCAEILVLLQNIRSILPNRRAVSPRKVKDQPSPMSQMERLQLPMTPPAKKTPETRGCP
ncbi:erich6 [Pungitius sinensis]